MTHNTKEELERLFKLAVPLAKEFNKRTYSDLFQSKYEEFKPLFDAIERECAEADNPDEAVEEVASVIPDAMHQILEKAGSKRKKEQILMNYNMGMVSFIIPMMRYGRTPVCEKVVDRMIVLWNDNGLEMDLGKSSYEDIEVRNSSRDMVPQDWIRKQTLVNAERYITKELKDYEEQILGAEGEIYRIETEIYAALVAFVQKYIRDIQANCAVTSDLDVLSGFAFLAEKNSYCRPVVDKSLSIDIKEGRHPVIETLMKAGEEYVPNDIFMDSKSDQVMILTGPNMAGKSALLLRQLPPHLRGLSDTRELLSRQIHGR